MTSTTGGDDHQDLPWWFWLMPETLFGVPFLAALFGGVFGVVLLRTQRVGLGLVVILAWLAYLVFAVRLVTRRKYVRYGLALFLAFMSVALAVLAFFMR